MPSETAPRQILVVDDERMIRHLTRTLLESLGFRVLTATDGAEALALYRSRRGEIDLVMLDLCMPGMSGPEVLDELRRADPQVRVLIFSAHAETDGPALLHRGARGLVPKPFKVDFLVDSIERALAPA